MPGNTATHVSVRMHHEDKKNKNQHISEDKARNRRGRGSLRKVVPEEADSQKQLDVSENGCEMCFNTTTKKSPPRTLNAFLDLAVRKEDGQRSSLPAKGTYFFWSPFDFLNDVHEFCLECQTLLAAWGDVLKVAGRIADDTMENRKTTLPKPQIADPKQLSQYGFSGGLPYQFEHIVLSRDIDYLNKEQLEAGYINNVTQYIDELKSVYKEQRAQGEKYSRVLLPNSKQFEEDGMFTGENLLHILIVKQDESSYDNLRVLLDTCQEEGLPKILTLRATGLFFQPPFLVKPHWRAPYLRWLMSVLGWDPIFRNPWTACYFGELPLSFAASVGNTRAMDMLYEAVRAPPEGEESKEERVHRRTKRVLAWMQQHDQFGNTALHMAVKYKNRAVVDWFVSKCKRLKNWDCFKRLNFELRTPLTMAVQIGHMDLFDYMLEHSDMKRVIWHYGRCSHTEIDLDQIDSWQETIPVGRVPEESEFRDVWLFPIEIEELVEPKLEAYRRTTKNPMCMWAPPLYDLINKEIRLEHKVGKKVASLWRDPHPLGAVEVAVKHEVPKSSSNPLFKDIVQHKWDTHVRRSYFLIAVLPYIAFLTCVTLYAAHRAEVHREALAAGAPPDSVAQLGSAGETIYELLFMTVFTMLLLSRAALHQRADYADLDVNMDRKIEWNEFESFMFKNLVSYMSFLIVVLMWTAWSLRAGGNADWEMNVLSVLGMLAWTNGATFLLPFRFFGILILSVHRMVVIDLLKFLVVYGFALLGFSLGIHVLLHNAEPTALNLALEESCGDCDTNWFSMTLRYLWASLGEVDLSSVMLEARTPWLALMLHIIFIVLSTILLLNLLIALLSRTFVETEELGNERWWHEFAGTVLRHEDFYTKIVIPFMQRMNPTHAAIYSEHLRTGKPAKGKCVTHRFRMPFYLPVTRSHDNEDAEDLTAHADDDDEPQKDVEQ